MYIDFRWILIEFKSSVILRLIFSDFGIKDEFRTEFTTTYFHIRIIFTIIIRIDGQSLNQRVTTWMMNGWTKTLEKSGNFRDIKFKCNILRQTCVKHMLKRKLDWPKIIIVHIEFYDLPKSKPILQMLVTNFFYDKINVRMILSYLFIYGYHWTAEEETYLKIIDVLKISMEPYVNNVRKYNVDL